MEQNQPNSKIVKLPESISVRTLASLLKVDPSQVISKLISNGVMAHINQNIDYDTAALLVEEFGFVAEAQEKSTVSVQKNFDSKDAVTRPPIVTIMGHVDHGKTTLLDYIRSAKVAQSESGGITQHISAYQIEFTPSGQQKRKITFVDTPGHEAFSALRAHGASLTDLVVLVVAADDGVKPQTVEVIEHAKKAGVPIIVAINKIDVTKANIERVKQELAEHELVSEEWGGKTVMVPISAKSGEGVDNLLEMIILTADLLELKADPSATPEGIIIEGKLDKQAGSVATALIYNGTVRPGQVIVTGKTYGRIRSLEDDQGQKLVAALPSQPVRILGLKDVPTFGDRLEVVPNEKVAKSMTQSGGRQNFHQAGEDEEIYTVVLKADVGGSLAALEDVLGKLNYRRARVEIIASGIGAVNENDIQMAKSAKALIISFRLATPKRVLELAQKEDLQVKEYWVIYEAVDYVTEELHRIATPTFQETEIGRLKILKVFSQKKDEAIVGGEVVEGVATDGKIKIYRDKAEIGTAQLEGLQLNKVAVDRVERGAQCGMSLKSVSTAIQEGDFLNFIEVKEI